MSTSESNHLTHVSANIQRSSWKRRSDQIDVLDIINAKRRFLKFETLTPQKAYNEDGVVSATLCEPANGMASRLGSKLNHEAFTQLHSSPKNFIESDSMDPFGREIRIEILEIVDLVDEMDGVRSIIDGEFKTRCTLEIFLAEYENEAGRVKLTCGDDVWRSQQICLLRTLCDDFGHSTSKFVMPKAFIIQTKDLLVKRRSRETTIARNENSILSLSNQYIIKVRLEAPGIECQWPPLELESNLDPCGRIMTNIREGALSSTAMRLIGKGVLLPEGGTGDKLNLILKLGDFRVRTNYALKLDIRYSIPAQLGIPMSIPQLCVEESSSKSESMAKVYVPAADSEVDFPAESDTIDASMGEHEASNPRKQRRAPPPSLAVPCTKKRLCGDVIKDILTAGERLDLINDEVETDWQITRHVEMIKDLSDITNTMKEYVTKWNLHIYPLQLSCNFYLPQVVLGFVKENSAWFSEDFRRVKEFSIHATSLRLRGGIDIECFVSCTDFLRNCISPHTGLVHPKSTEIQNRDHLINGDFQSKCFTDETPVDMVAVSWEKKSGNSNINHSEKNKRNVRGIDAKTVGKKVWELEPSFGESLGGGAADENEPLQNTSYQKSGSSKGTQIVRRDEVDDYVEGEETFEDATEELDNPALDDFVDTKDRINDLAQPFYLHSYWQSIIERWPRIKLHGPYSFGVASMLAAIAIFQGFPDDNIDRLIALFIHYCPNEDITELIYMYYHAAEIMPEVEGVCMTELKLHRIMWEASRETCEYWLTDVYRLEGGTRRTVHEAIETATNEKAWDELWECVCLNNVGDELMDCSF